MPLKAPYPTAADGQNTKQTISYFFPARGNESGQFPWLRNDYNPKIEDGLCRVCRQLDFKYLLKTVCPNEIHLGTFKEVKTRDCAFCRLFMEDTYIAPLFRADGINDDDDVFLSSSNVNRLSSWRKKGENSLELASVVLSIVVTRFQPGKPGIIFGVAYGTVHAIQDEPSTTKKLLSARLISPSYDANHVRAWLKECPRSSIPPTEDHAFNFIERFIDTIEQKLIEVRKDDRLQIPLSASFAALSYVWGKNGQQVTLTKATHQKLHSQGAITSANLSKTIKDAIRVCQDIGIRYLWVDALCIIQDDNGPDKMRQIKNLHHIYMNASVTIVATFGDSANAGLPGVDPDSKKPRQLLARIQGLKFVKQSLDLDNFLSQTHWKTRAWTFQEFLLSPRRLVFTGKAIYFSCAHGVRSEDLTNPSHSSGLLYKGDFRRSGYDFQLEDKLNWTTYAELVSNYTARQLTNQTDILPAFAALSKVLQEELFFDAPFVSGLPISSLDAALLWRRCLGCDSCRNTSRGLKKSGGKFYMLSPFAPSWSWASWIGHVQYSPWILNNENPAWSIIPKLSWLEVEEGSRQEMTSPNALSRPVRKIETWKPTMFIDDHWKPMRGGLTLGGSTIYSQPLLGGFEEQKLAHSFGYLYLEADVATFIVGGRLLEGHDEDRETGNYMVEGQNGGVGAAFGVTFGNPLALYDQKTKVRCGAAYEDLDLSTIGIKPPCQCDFIKLSQTTLSELHAGTPPESLKYAFGGSSKRDFLPREEGFIGNFVKPDTLHNFFAYNEYDCSDIWCVYNVLMVVWNEDETVAFRVGVGKMHVNAFDNAPSLKHRRLFLG
jgi:hypothetical protein